MAVHQIPQLRIAVNGACGKACAYCRPSGEMAAPTDSVDMSVAEIVRLVELLARVGVNNIKLTGGDPALYRDIVPLVAGLRSLPTVDRIELITRHPRCGRRAAELRTAGLDRLNFSLDSLNAETWREITGVAGHKQLIAAIEEAASTGIAIKINMVVLKGVNDHEIPYMVSFCRRMGADLKLLDLIVDIGEFAQDISDYARRHYDDLIDVMADFEAKGAIRRTSLSPGGLGHPMPTFRIEDGPLIQVKTARLGAWYGDICRSCRHFPCHDALMALRLTPAGMLQRCLLRSDNLIDLLTPLRTGVPDHAIQERIDDALATYRSARFYEFDEIARIRAEEVYNGSAYE